MSLKVKVFGERNTGTNYISKLVENNFDVRILSDGPPYKWEKRFGLGSLSMNTYTLLTRWRNMGWKHSVPKLTEQEVASSFFICVTKNPYSWLLSLHKRPYHNRTAADLPFSEFIRSPWPLMRCDNIKAKSVMPAEMWNIKNRAYLDLSKAAQMAIFLKYEDMLEEPEAFIKDFALKSGQDLGGNIALLNHGAKSADRNKKFDDYKDYYLNEKWREKLTASDISYINEQLDSALMQEISYSIL